MTANFILNNGENPRNMISHENGHIDTWQPFQIVRLKQVVNTDREVFVRVRKLYRCTWVYIISEKPYLSTGILKLLTTFFAKITKMPLLIINFKLKPFFGFKSK